MGIGESPPLEPLQRPHMVMVVGNRVKGDSRVEKAAQTAHQAGYRVTVIGLIHRTVPACDSIGDVPIYRVAPVYSMYGAWRLHHDESQVDPHSAARSARRELRRLHVRGRTDALSKIRTFIATLRGRADDPAVRRRLLNIRVSGSNWLARLPIRGIWRRAWPLIADLELAFSKALIDLEPDIVHVHDRDPLPAAETTKKALGNAGHPMRWVYDAHEWLPGVVFTGPKVHKTAWLAAEAELISRADAVITVSEERARALAKRHALSTTPTVVTNSPRSVLLPDSGGRTTVREECGLDPHTPLLVYVGRIDERRGVDTVVRALTSLPDVHLAVVAPADRRPRIELSSLAADLGVEARLHLLDYVASASVTWYISTATVGVSPLQHNPAHHQDLATKVREYLHAGLPVVGSDVRCQARFLTETGVGTVHRAGDPNDCARAIADVLQKSTSFQSAITEELLVENSWEEQEKVLVNVWASLLDRPPSRSTATSRVSPQLTVGPVVDAERTTRLVEAIRSYRDIGGHLISRIEHTGHPEIQRLVNEGAPLGPKLEEYRRIVAEADGLLLEDLAPLFGGLLGNAAEQLDQLVKVLRVAVMLDPVAGLDPDHALEQIADSWLQSLDVSQREKIARQGRRTRGLINGSAVRVLATSPLPMPDLAHVEWLPTVVQIEPEVPMHSGAIKVMVAPGPRGGRDRTTPEAIAKMVSPKLRFVEHISEPPSPEALRDVDILIDNLGHGFYTDVAARALGSGCVVLSSITDEARDMIPASCPVLNVTPDAVPDVLADLVTDRERCSRLMSDGIVYARETHDGRRSAAIVAATLGW